MPFKLSPLFWIASASSLAVNRPGRTRKDHWQPGPGCTFLKAGVLSLYSQLLQVVPLAVSQLELQVEASRVTRTVTTTGTGTVLPVAVNWQGPHVEY